MQLIEHTTTWAHGDLAQGKIMLIAGGLMFVAGVLAWKSGGEMLRGMLIPIGLVILICAGYGGFMQYNRSAHLNDLAQRSIDDPEAARTAEVARISKDCKNYTMMNYIWTVIFMVGAALILFGSSGALKGVGLGLVLLAAVGFLVDNFLHARAEVYLAAIQ